MEKEFDVLVGELRQKVIAEKPTNLRSFCENFFKIQENDDDIDDIPQFQQPRGRRTSVSAESIQPTNEKHEKIVIPKTEEQKRRILNSVKNNFLFKNLDEEQQKDVINAMCEKQYKPQDDVIQQGAVGDYFYIVESGELDVYVRDRKVTEYNNQGSFGELALMYNAPRAATVRARTACVLWALDRVTFRRILLDTTSRKRRMYESFLEEVSLLKSLEAYERHKIADALESVQFNDGELIIKQGDLGDTFYLIESGECRLFQLDEQNKEHELPSLKQGDYFGELALLSNKPRAATVKAKGKVRLAALNKDAFDRLLGPVLEIVKRNANQYKELTRRKSIKEMIERLQ